MGLKMGDYESEIFQFRLNFSYSVEKKNTSPKLSEMAYSNLSQLHSEIKKMSFIFLSLGKIFLAGGGEAIFGSELPDVC